MSKAVLVMDMPRHCIECRFNDMDFCQAIHRGGESIPDDMLEFKPDWCPLVPLPEKITEPIDADDVGKDYSQGTMDGWNACIDAITGE